MTTKSATANADIEVWSDGDAAEHETTKVGDDALAVSEAVRAAQLSKETRKATAFDLATALERARPSFADEGESGYWPRGSAPAAEELEIPIDVALPEPRRSGRWAHAVFDLVLVVVVVAAASLLLSR